MTVRYCLQLLLTSLWVAALAGVPVAATPVRPLSGSLIFARGGTEAKYLWDASNYVAKLASTDTLGAAGMRAIEATSVTALSGKARLSRAQTLSLEVFYKRSSANSFYGTPTFAAQERLLVVTVRRVEVLKKGLDWAKRITDGKIPGGVTLQILGRLNAR